MNQEGWRASVESGERGAAIVAAELCGRAFWGAPTIPPIIQWDKRTVCQAQDWVDRSPRKDLYDFTVTSPACNKCEYVDTCKSMKPYSKRTKERHEVKTNYATHMTPAVVEPGKSTGKTQNLYIEIYQNYACWKETQDNKHLGWYHPDKKGKRPAWYHFYQPMDDQEGDGKHIDATEHATEEDKAVFCELAQPGDSLITKNPWGYIFSMTAEALERLIMELDAQNKIESKTDPIDKVEIAKYIRVIDIEPNGKDIIYTPVFREIGKNGDTLTQYPIRKRFIPKWMKDKIIDDKNPELLTPKIEQLQKLINPQNGKPLISICKEGYILNFSDRYKFLISFKYAPIFIEQAKIISPPSFIKYPANRLYTRSPGRGGMPLTQYDDLIRMGVLDTEGGALYDIENLLSSQ